MYTAAIALWTLTTETDMHVNSTTLLNPTLLSRIAAKRPGVHALVERLKASPLYVRLRAKRMRMAAKGLRNAVIARWSLS